jgi:hypothetical protein
MPDFAAPFTPMLASDGAAAPAISDPREFVLLHSDKCLGRHHGYVWVASAVGLPLTPVALGTVVQ